MYCSSCGARLSEGTYVCGQCQPRPVEPMAAGALPGVHPACHVIAAIVGIKLLMGLFSLWRIASYMFARPGNASSMRFSFLLLPVPGPVYLMLSACLLLTTVACLFGLYVKDRRAWGVLLGLRAIFLPLSLYGVYNFVTQFLMRSGGYGMGAYWSNVPFLINTLMILIGPLLDVAVIVLLLGFKRQLVR